MKARTFRLDSSILSNGLAVAALWIALSGAAVAQTEPAADPVAKPVAGAPGDATAVAAAAYDLDTARGEPKRIIQYQYALFDRLVASGKDVEAMRAEIVRSMDDFVDFEEFARLTVKEQWDSFSDAQKTDYVSLFKQLIQRTYSKKFKPDSRLTVTYHGDAEQKKDRARLKTTIASGGVEADVEYRLLQKSSPTSWWVYDIVIDDVSLMRNYRSQFQRIVKSDGVDALFAKLREKVESGEE